MASADPSSTGPSTGPYRPPPPKSLPKRAASEPSHLSSAVSFTVDVRPLTSSQIRYCAVLVTPTIIHFCMHVPIDGSTVSLVKNGLHSVDMIHHHWKMLEWW